MKITLGWVVSYAVGIPLLLSSLILAYFSLWGLIPVAFSLLLLPVVRRLLASRADIEISRGAAVAIGIVGVISLFVIVSALTVGAILDHDAVDVNGTTVSFDGDEDAERDVSPVELQTQDASFSNPDYSITARWNATTQTSIHTDPDSALYYSSDPGEKFLIVRLRITNTGENEFEPDPDLFRVEIDGVEYHHRNVGDSGGTLRGVTQSPDSTREGWTVFVVPEDATEGTLVTHQEAYRDQNVSVSFEHDPEMPVDIPERD